MMSICTEEDGSKIFLVDFQQKSLEQLSEKRRMEKRAEEERKKHEDEVERQLLAEPVPEPATPDEEW